MHYFEAKAELKNQIKNSEEMAENHRFYINKYKIKLEKAIQENNQQQIQRLNQRLCLLKHVQYYNRQNKRNAIKEISQLIA